MNIPNEAIIKQNISKENINYYKEKGFLVAESLFDKSEVYSLIDTPSKL